MRRTAWVPVPILALALVTALAISGCLGASATAQATLHRVTHFGDGVAEEVSGYANLTQQGGRVTVRVDVWGLEPGPKGTHIHAGTSCGRTFSLEGGSTPGGAAGGHFNPGNESHPHHAGDLGNLMVDADGRGVLEVTVEGVNLHGDDAWGVLGRTVVVHAGEDDLESQPAGDAGARLLCGIIGSS